MSRAAWYEFYKDVDDVYLDLQITLEAILKQQKITKLYNWKPETSASLVPE